MLKTYGATLVFLVGWSGSLFFLPPTTGVGWVLSLLLLCVVSMPILRAILQHGEQTETKNKKRS